MPSSKNRSAVISLLPDAPFDDSATRDKLSQCMPS